MARLTKEQAREFADRWTRINAAEIEELKATSPSVSLRQLDSLLSASDSLGWREGLEEGVEEVRARWNRLRAIRGA